MSTKPSGETFAFKTEVTKLLDIITHSIYTHREIFLRELVSNASDALDKVRFLQSRGDAVRDPDLELGIDIRIDKDAGTITVQDTGVGMTRDEVVENIGTIARSGSEQFMSALAEANGEGKDASNIIGRFGVGFYSVFMVADSVIITTLSAQENAEPVRWVSTGLEEFTVETPEDDDAPTRRGTTVVLHLKEDAAEYLEADRLKSVIKKHSSFVSFPLRLDDEHVNTVPALWREPKSSVTEEQYADFYKHLTFDSEAPLETVHIAVDAPVQFNALLFVPPRNLDVLGFDRNKYGLDLYVRRVLIERENKDLIPEYLGFVKGVVDTEDLPLNLSRETLQENALVRKIGTTVTKQILGRLEKLAKEKPADYEKFWNAHGKTFKFGYADYANQERWASLLRFNSSANDDAEGLTSLDDYISRHTGETKAIYYVSGPSREAAHLNPHLEIFRRKGIEVLYLFEPIDEFAMDSVRTYKEFALTSVEQANMDDLEKLPDIADDADKKDKAEALGEEGEKALETLLAGMKEILGDRVTEVKVSRRLSDSPCCLVAPDGGMTSSMEKILRTVSKDTSLPQRAMEINPDHKLVRNLLRIHKSDPADAYIATATEQLFESAMLLEGYLQDPHALVERINRLLEQSSGWYADVTKK